MQKAVFNGIECFVAEGQRSDKVIPPEGFPHAYELRHGEDWGIPRAVETFVGVNFWGTLFSREPFPLKDGVCTIRSFSVEGGPCWDTMESVCPACGEPLSYGFASYRSGVILAEVSCPACGFEGEEEHTVRGIYSEDSPGLLELEDGHPDLDTAEAAATASGIGEIAPAEKYAVEENQGEMISLEVLTADNRCVFLTLSTIYEGTTGKKDTGGAA